jgi:hypothetical protein
MAVCGDDCFFGLHCFSLPDAVWQTSFSPHEQHSSMQKAFSYACEDMLTLKKKTHMLTQHKKNL